MGYVPNKNEIKNISNAVKKKLFHDIKTRYSSMEKSKPNFDFMGNQDPTSPVLITEDNSSPKYYSIKKIKAPITPRNKYVVCSPKKGDSTINFGTTWHSGINPRHAKSNMGTLKKNFDAPRDS